MNEVVYDLDQINSGSNAPDPVAQKRYFSFIQLTSLCLCLFITTNFKPTCQIDLKFIVIEAFFRGPP